MLGSLQHQHVQKAQVALNSAIGLICSYGMQLNYFLVTTSQN